VAFATQNCQLEWRFPFEALCLEKCAARGRLFLQPIPKAILVDKMNRMRGAAAVSVKQRSKVGNRLPLAEQRGALQSLQIAGTAILLTPVNSQQPIADQH
jgi:hypothetical protein